MDYLDLLTEDIKSNKVLKITLDSNIYSKAMILKSTYKFTDRVYIYITMDKDCYEVYFKPKDSNEINISILSGEFMNELLDQELRAMIINDTSKIRNVIVTRALISGQPNG